MKLLTILAKILVLSLAVLLPVSCSDAKSSAVNSLQFTSAVQAYQAYLQIPAELRTSVTQGIVNLPFSSFGQMLVDLSGGDLPASSVANLKKLDSMYGTLGKFMAAAHADSSSLDATTYANLMTMAQDGTKGGVGPRFEMLVNAAAMQLFAQMFAAAKGAAGASALALAGGSPLYNAVSWWRNLGLHNTSILYSPSQGMTIIQNQAGGARGLQFNTQDGDRRQGFTISAAGNLLYATDTQYPDGIPSRLTALYQNTISDAYNQPFDPQVAAEAGRAATPLTTGTSEVSRGECLSEADQQAQQEAATQAQIQALARSAAFAFGTAAGCKNLGG